MFLGTYGLNSNILFSSSMMLLKLAQISLIKKKPNLNPNFMQLWISFYFYNV